MTDNNQISTMKLSNQALGCMMMALQKSLLEESDITVTLKDFQFVNTEDGLWIKNPPMVKYSYAENAQPSEAETEVV
jgi:hypothetical protein|tara:strand:- start:702 stop:932 length:231 start_codon:yes stop_codon:yes gene_type:complete